MFWLWHCGAPPVIEAAEELRENVDHCEIAENDATDAEATVKEAWCCSGALLQVGGDVRGTWVKLCSFSARLRLLC